MLNNNLVKGYKDNIKSLSFSDNELVSKIRKNAFTDFINSGFPKAYDENWRYTKQKFLKEINFKTSNHISENFIEPELEIDAYHLVFIDGKFITKKSIIPNNVEIKSFKNLIEGDDSNLLKKITNSDFVKSSPLALLNTAYLENGFYINVKKDTILNKPIHIINYSDTADIFYNVKYYINIEDGSKIDLVESCYSYKNISYFNNTVTEINIAKNAIVNHYKYQNESKSAYHVCLNKVTIDADSSYENFIMQKGGLIARNETVIDVIGENTNTKTLACYMLKGTTHSDLTTRVNHHTPNASSEQTVKGVADDETKAIFQGKVYVARGAQKVSGNQLHKSLLLSDKAEIDTKPELEVYADDVECSHGASIGELDDKQLFYLRARGIDEELARKMLVEAFLDEVLEKMSNETLRQAFVSVIKRD